MQSLYSHVRVLVDLPTNPQFQVLLSSLTLVASGMTVSGLPVNPHPSHRLPTTRTSSIAIGPSIQSCNADTSTPVTALPFQVDDAFPAREMRFFSIVDPLLFQRSPPLVPRSWKKDKFRLQAGAAGDSE